MIILAYSLLNTLMTNIRLKNLRTLFIINKKMERLYSDMIMPIINLDWGFSAESRLNRLSENEVDPTDVYHILFIQKYIVNI